MKTALITGITGQDGSYLAEGDSGTGSSSLCVTVGQVPRHGGTSTLNTLNQTAA